VAGTITCAQPNEEVDWVGANERGDSGLGCSRLMSGMISETLRCP
jgi:hypothetical protein